MEIEITTHRFYKKTTALTTLPCSLGAVDTGIEVTQETNSVLNHWIEGIST